MEPLKQTSFLGPGPTEKSVINSQNSFSSEDRLLNCLLSHLPLNARSRGHFHTLWCRISCPIHMGTSDFENTACSIIVKLQLFAIWLKLQGDLLPWVLELKTVVVK